MWMVIALVTLILVVLYYQRKNIRAIKVQNLNPSRKSLPKGSYIIESYCYDKNDKLFFITLNYASWEEACRVRNEMVGKKHINIDYDNKTHYYTVMSTKICQVGLNGK